VPWTTLISANAGGGSPRVLYVPGHAMLGDGYFRVGRVAGVDLRLHWSVPAGALLFVGLSFEPVAWLAYLLVILVHELGHALLVRSRGLRVLGLDITGFGGHCRWRGSADPLTHAWIAWGGVLAQLGLLLCTLSVRAAFGAPESQWGMQFSHTFINVNLWIIALNLLPFPPLDGARAWGLFSQLRARGWTPGRALLGLLQAWAERRRQARGATPSARPEVAARSSGRSSPAPSEPEPTDPSPLDDPAVQPSPQAQRELAALLQRIGDEASRAKRRR
jgi:Zn-dependent protease